MNATPANEVEMNAALKEGVGQHLRRAREALGLERAEAAAGLYLKESIIVALEEDDHDALPSPVFVQGYLRKYARLLNISEEPLLKAYRNLALPQKQQKKCGGPLAGSPIKQEIRSNHTVVRLITWGLVVGLLALVAAWWQSDMRWPVGQLGDESPAVAQDRPSEHSFAPDLPKSNDEISQAGDELSPVKPAVLQEAKLQSEIAASDKEKQQNESLAEVVEAIESAAPIAKDVIPIQESGLDRVLGSATEALNESTPTREAQGQPEPQPMESVEEKEEPPIDYANSIVIEFAEACWTEIRGANKSYKLLGNMPKDTRHVLAGEPPYTFLLGNSHAVTLTIKGRRFDVKAHSKGNIARFVLQAEDIAGL